MNIVTKERLANEYDIYVAIEEAVKDDELDFSNTKDLQDYDSDLAPLLQDPNHFTTALALMRRYKQEDRLEKLSEIHPTEYAASGNLIWAIQKVSRNDLMANELLFLKINPSRLRLLPEAYYEIMDKKSKAFGEIRPIFRIPDEVLITAFFILPLNDQFKAIEQAERQTLSAKIIELLIAMSKEHQWPVSDQFRKPFRWTEPGPDPSVELHNAIHGMDVKEMDTYIGGHLISDYMTVTDHLISGLNGEQPTEEILKIAESVCEAYARELTAKTYKPSPEEQAEIQEEVDKEQAEQSARHENTKIAE